VNRRWRDGRTKRGLAPPVGADPLAGGRMDPRTTPTDIGPTSDGTRLRIVWADGHVSEYSPRYLRLHCRCASCVDEISGRPRLDPRSVPEDVYPLAIHYVGRYAIRFDWSDGHGTGIYPYELLRKICPCEECDIEEAAS
jgi:DUF971 family protein